MALEAGFAELGLRLRLQLGAALTDAASRWIEAPGLGTSTAAEANADLPGNGPAVCWHIASARAPAAPYRLRAVIDRALPPEAFVAAAYQAVLGRRPDKDGLAQFSAWLEREPNAQGALLEMIAASAEAAERPEVFRITLGPMRAPTSF